MRARRFVWIGARQTVIGCTRARLHTVPLMWAMADCRSAAFKVLFDLGHKKDARAPSSILVRQCSLKFGCLVWVVVWVREQAEKIGSQFSRVHGHVRRTPSPPASSMFF